MSGHKSFKILRDEIDADPVRRARMEELTRAYDTVFALAALRPVRGRTQKQIAEGLGVSEASVSQVKNQDDLCLSTLAKHVATLGGRLEITAVFPDQRIRLGVPTGDAPKCDKVSEQLDGE